MIELLVALAVVLSIMGLALPSFLHARVSSACERHEVILDAMRVLVGDDVCALTERNSGWRRSDHDHVRPRVVARVLRRRKVPNVDTRRVVAVLSGEAEAAGHRRARSTPGKNRTYASGSGGLRSIH